MSEAQWYCVNAAREQIGPVSADFIRNAARDGSLSAASLVWREGMAQWLPLSQVAGELGITSLGPPPISLANATLEPGPVDPPPAWTSIGSVGKSADIVFAGFVRRWAALFLDSLILTIPLAIVAASIGAASGMFAQEGLEHERAFQLLYYVMYFIAAPLYFAGMESSGHQATLGKQALGIKVTDLDGRRISFGQALGRWFAAALSYLTLFIGFLMAAFTARKQALHDMIAGTLVVDRWAYTEFPERQKRGLSGCLVVFLIFMCLVPIIAILAAISISQYQDYVVRSQVQEAVALADGVKTAMAEYASNKHSFPPSNAAAGLPNPAQISGAYANAVDVGRRPGNIEVYFSSTSPHRANQQLNGASLVFTATLTDASIAWQCHSESIRQKWCPSSCDCR
jgi:uncharacterized RDD family membrane protein YckC/Tfp pilus assembly major pilin PilA